MKVNFHDRLAMTEKKRRKEMKELETHFEAWSDQLWIILDYIITITGELIREVSYDFPLNLIFKIS